MGLLDIVWVKEVEQGKNRQMMRDKPKEVEQRKDQQYFSVLEKKRVSP